MTDNERDLIDAVLQGSATINQLRLAVLNERATADWKRQVIEAQQLVNQAIDNRKAVMRKLGHGTIDAWDIFYKVCDDNGIPAV